MQKMDCGDFSAAGKMIVHAEREREKRKREKNVRPYRRNCVGNEL